MRALPQNFKYTIAIFFIAFGCFISSLGHNFTLEDQYQIVKNPLIKNLADSAQIFATATHPGNLYRPLTIYSFAINYYFSELAPFSYHLVNLILYALTCSLVFVLLNQLFSLRTALIVSIFFAIHPLHVEVVSNVYGRAEILSHLLGVGCILLSLSSLYLWTPICMLLALLANESALVYLLLVPLILILKFGLASYKSILKQSVLLGSATFVYFNLRSKALGSFLPADFKVDFLDNPLINLSSFDRLINAWRLLGKYISLTILPFPLSTDYSFSQIDLIAGFSLTFAQFFDLTLVTLFFISIFICLKRASLNAFWPAWFFCGFAFTSNLFFPIGTIFAERLAFIPTLGVLGFVISVLDKIKPVRNILIFYAVFLSIGTILQNRFWKDDFSLYSRQIVVSPDSAKTQANFALLLVKKNNWEQAAEHFLLAIKIYPQYVGALHGLATTYFQRQLWAESEVWLKRALEVNPDFQPSLEALARLYLNTGRYDLADKIIEQALTINPNQQGILNTLLALKIIRRDWEQAKVIRDKILMLEPTNAEVLELSKPIP